MELKSFQLKQSFQTVNWLGNDIVDWCRAGMLYSLKGETKQLNKYHFGFTFDRAINSVDGQYVFIYQILGTKGLLIKNGEILREINRSYYQSNLYEYPASFIMQNGITYLAHCPFEYCRLEFEEVETGRIVTNISDRKPSDYFHSRLEISPNGKYLMSKGWIWHPLDTIQIYNIEDCLLNPLHLDILNFERPNVGTEISTASFINNSSILIGSSEEEALNEDLINILPSKSIAVWNLESNIVSDPISLKYEFGNLVAINETFAWDTYNFPKIINIQTGEIILKAENIASGKQRSAIITHDETTPVISINKDRTKLAINNKDDLITVLSFE
jgi:hypothetical protein